MSVTSRDLCLTGVRPVRIAALMELYERNFRLVQCLVPDLDLPFDQAVSRSATDVPLRLSVLERSRYTAAFRLTYEFQESGQAPRLEPNLEVRAYRDARLAEALTCPLRPPWRAEGEGDPAAGHYLDAQWERNLLLHKWLHYLLENGHGFGMSGRPRRRPA